ncbi:hypothetical protein GCM10010404_57090 [Nonomuraea africana]
MGHYDDQKEAEGGPVISTVELRWLNGVVVRPGWLGGHVRTPLPRNLRRDMRVFQTQLPIHTSEWAEPLKRRIRKDRRTAHAFRRVALTAFRQGNNGWRCWMGREIGASL